MKAMTEQDSLIEQYEVGDESVSVSTPVEISSATTTVETPAVLPPRDEAGRFVKPITPDQAHTSHTAYLVRIAKNLGFSDEEIQGIPPETLGLAVAKVQETKQAERREASAERTQHEAAAQSRQSSGIPPVPPQIDKFELPDEEYDDKLLGVLKRQDKELKALRAELQQLRNVEINRQNETLTQKLDRLFAGQPKERFGDGPGKKLDGKSPEMKRRMAVLREMETLGPGDIEDHFQKAVKTIYGDSKPVEANPIKELEERQEQFRNGGVARPTHRNGAPEPKGVSKATSSVAEVLKEMGAASSEDSTSVDEFLG
jgi:hypothetical protein